MSEICIRRRHGKTPAAARAAAERLADELKDEFDLDYSWHDEVMRFARSGLSGELVFEGDEVVLNIRLGFLLSAFGASIESEAHRFFDENFGR